jgi:uncharacterized protein
MLPLYPTYRQSWVFIGWFLLATLIGSIPAVILKLGFNFDDAIVLTVGSIVPNLLLIWFLLRQKRKAAPDFQLSFRSVALRVYLLLLIVTLTTGILSEPLMNLLHIPDFMGDSFKELYKEPIVSFLLIAVIAPVLEEIIFRGIVLDGLLKNEPVNKAVIQSALLFGIIHFNPAQAIGAFALGLVMGWVYANTQSLWACIFIHFVNNFTSWLLYQLPSTRQATTLGDFFENKGWYVAMLVFCGAILYFSLKSLSVYFRQHIPVQVPVEP